MANLRRRGNRWQARVYASGKTETRTFRTRQEAAQWALGRESELTLGRRGGPLLHTLHDALERYGVEVSPFKRGKRWEALRLTAWKRDVPFVGERIDRITPETVGRWRDDRLKVVSAGTVLRELTLLASVFETARREWRWLPYNPVRDVRKPAQPKPRSREFTDKEVTAIVKATGLGKKATKPKHEVGVALLFALETAMRAGEICSLAPSQVRGTVAHLDQTKNGDSREVPLSKEALRLWKMLPGGFTLTPRTLDTLFRKYRDRAKVEGVRFHDSRRTAIGRLSKKLQVMDLAKMTGHRDLKVLLNTYYSPKSADVAKLLG